MPAWFFFPSLFFFWMDIPSPAGPPALVTRFPLNGTATEEGEQKSSHTQMHSSRFPPEKKTELSMQIMPPSLLFAACHTPIILSSSSSSFRTGNRVRAFEMLRRRKKERRGGKVSRRKRGEKKHWVFRAGFVLHRMWSREQREETDRQRQIQP